MSTNAVLWPDGRKAKLISSIRPRNTFLTSWPAASPLRSGSGARARGTGEISRTATNEVCTSIRPRRSARSISLASSGTQRASGSASRSSWSRRSNSSSGSCSAGSEPTACAASASRTSRSPAATARQRCSPAEASTCSSPMAKAELRSIAPPRRRTRRRSSSVRPSACAPLRQASRKEFRVFETI